MERKIGKVFRFEGKWLKVQEGESLGSCEHCYFEKEDCSRFRSFIGVCTHNERSDKKGVIFEDITYKPEENLQAKQPQQEEQPKLNLCEILKDCPKGTKFYSSIYGDLLYSCMQLRLAFQKITFIKPNTISSVDYYRDGKYCQGQGECTIFPSRDCRDWSKFSAPWYKKEELIKPKFKVGDIIRRKESNKNTTFKIRRVYDDLYVIDDFAEGIYIKNQDQYELVSSKFDPKTLSPFDRVLVRNHNRYRWTCDLFSDIIDGNKCIYHCINSYYEYCIPYNDETKHLVGTKDEAPEYYRYWEE